MKNNTSNNETDGFVMAGEVLDGHAAAGLVVLTLPGNVPADYETEADERGMLDEGITHLHLHVHAEHEKACC